MIGKYDRHFFVVVVVTQTNKADFEFFIFMPCYNSIAIATIDP